MSTNRRSRSLYGVSREDVSDGFAVKIEEVGGGITYIGKAEVGTATSASSWRIMRVTEAGKDTDVEYADGDDYFDNVWDDRASLSYS